MVGSTGMEIVHTMIKYGKIDQITAGKVKKTLIHEIHHIIHTMESMNTNHLNKRNFIKDKEAEARRV